MDIKKSKRLFSLLENLNKKFERLTVDLSKPETINDQQQFKTLSKEFARLKPLVESYKKLSSCMKQLDGAEELLKTADDEELVTMAQEEVELLSKDIVEIETEIQEQLVTDEKQDNRNAFLEIRAGAGGNEASLFASDLLRMYIRYTENRGWKSEVISTTYSAIGGIKEIILYIKGEQANRYSQFESGVHRVQRVPVTESGGRIHTSTVTVAVMPEVDDVDVELNAKDLRVDTFSASGPGGQHVNRTQSAIRVTHFPTGIVVTCQDEKSQHKNKEKAISVLKARIHDFEKQQQEQEIANDRKSQVGTGDRSEKIRTYNYPQNRVTDHRISGRNFNLETILEGQLVDLVTELLSQQNKKRLDDRLNQIIA